MTIQNIPTPAAGGSYLLQPDGTLKRLVDSESLVDSVPASQPTPEPNTKTPAAKE